MSDLAVCAYALVALVALLLLRIPVAVALGGVSFVGLWVLVGIDAAFGIFKSIPYDFVAHWSLSSVPMFLLMGYICYHARLTDGLFELARVWLARLPGGLAVASIGAAAGFSAVTGSSVACAAAMGRIAIPEMLKSGYDKSLAAGTIASAGTIGSMIPPSIILLIYGIFVELPISKLFIAGLLPGVITALMYAAMIIVRCRITPALAPRTRLDVTWAERFGAFWHTWPVLAIIVGVFGGLFGGIFTPTEAGAVGAALSLIVAAVQGTLTLRNFRAAVVETMRSTAAIFAIAIGANVLVRFLAIGGFNDFVTDLVTTHELSELHLIIAMSAVFLFLGCFLDPIGIMLLTLPVFLPVAEHAGLDMIWFGILMTKWLEVALITPPVGLNVFVIKGVVGDAIRTETIFKGIFWFLATDLVFVVLLVSFPEMATWLPSLIE